MELMTTAAMIAILIFIIPISHTLTDEEMEMFKPRDPTFRELNTNLTTNISVTVVQDTIVIVSNGIPSHETRKWPVPGHLRKIYLKESIFQITIPKEPKMRPMNSPMMCTPLFIIGVATGGAYIFNPYSPLKGCPWAFDLEVQSMDKCHGHPNPKSAYHYHTHSSCNSMEVCGQPSPIFGVAIDGIPIYGPIDEYGKQLTYADLDLCGGKFDSKGRYKYHMVGDPPYVLNCFRGELHKNLVRPRGAEPKGLPPLFECTCPYDDYWLGSCREDIWCETEQGTPKEMAAFEERRKSKPRLVPNCEFRNVAGDYAECKDNVNTSNTLTWRQIRRPHTWNLIPCCPLGEDCGDNCNGNPKCHIEKRSGQYLRIEPKSEKSKTTPNCFGCSNSEKIGLCFLTIATMIVTQLI